MKKRLAVALAILFSGALQHSVLAQHARPFKISFEMNGKQLKTNLTVRIKQDDKLAEIKYKPNQPIRFPSLKPGQRFDLWIITDDYELSFLDMHPDALTVAGWRVGIDVYPFHLDYIELKALATQYPDVKLVYYMIYQHADGGETPIWIESSRPLQDLRVPRS